MSWSHFSVVVDVIPGDGDRMVANCEIMWWMLRCGR